MRIPDSLESLVSEGIITEVVRPLMSGKEAQVYLVESGGELRVAKIYKDAIHRSFKHRAEYTEGRGVRSSRDARAIQKRSKYGRAMDEEAWRSAEVDVIYRLRSAGVRVPEPFQFVDGVLIMELVKDAYGDPAPRLGDVELGPTEARRVFDLLLRETVRMLCADVVHGDLSAFNVLLDANGPVIIDFPQSVDASKNQTARELLVRDVDNLTHFLARHEPAMRGRPYGQEIWAAYETNELTPDTVLTGTWRPAQRTVNTNAMLDELAEVERDEVRRRVSKGLAPIGKKGAAPTSRPPLANGAARPSHGHPHAHGQGQAGRGGGPRDQRPPEAQHAARTAADSHPRARQHPPARAGGQRSEPRHTRPQEQRGPVVERGRVSGQQAQRFAAVSARSSGNDPRQHRRDETPPKFGAQAWTNSPRGDAPRGDAPRGEAPRGDAPRDEGSPPRRRRRRRRGGHNGSGGGGSPPPKVRAPS